MVWRDLTPQAVQLQRAAGDRPPSATADRMPRAEQGAPGTRNLKTAALRNEADAISAPAPSICWSLELPYSHTNAGKKSGNKIADSVAALNLVHTKAS